MREIRRIEAVNMPAPRRSNAAQCEHQTQRRLPRLRSSIRERLPFDSVLIGRKQKRQSLTANCLRELPFNHFSRPGLLLLFHAALALKRFERFREDFRRRFAVDASAFAVKVNWIGMQHRQQRRELYGRRLLTPVFLSEILKGKFLCGRGFPEKSRIKLCGSLRNARDQF